MSELCQSEGHQGQNLTHLGLNQTEPDSSQYPLPQNADLLTPRVPQAVPVLPLPYPEGWTQVTSTIKDLCYHFRAIVKYFGIALSFSSPLRPTNSALPQGTSNLQKALGMVRVLTFIILFCGGSFIHVLVLGFLASGPNTDPEYSKLVLSKSPNLELELWPVEFQISR